MSIIYLSIHPSIHPSISLSVCLPACLSVCLTASLKTQQFCETSSIFELGKIQNKAILRDFLNFWTWLDNVKKETSLRDFLKLWTWQHQKRNNSARLPEFSKLTSSKTKQFCETSSLRKSAPGPSNSSDEHVSCTAPAAENASLQILFKCPNACHRFWMFLEMPQNPHVLLTFDQVHNPLRLPRKTTSERPKVVRTCSAFNILTRNVLRATTACTFSTSQLPKVVRSWCALYILTCKMCFAPQRRAIVHLSSGQLAPHPPL